MTPHTGRYRQRITYTADLKDTERRAHAEAALLQLLTAWSATVAQDPATAAIYRAEVAATVDRAEYALKAGRLPSRVVAEVIAPVSALEWEAALDGVCFEESRDPRWLLLTA